MYVPGCVLLIHQLALVRCIQKVSRFLSTRPVQSQIDVRCILHSDSGWEPPPSITCVEGYADFFGADKRDVEQMVIVNYYFLRLLKPNVQSGWLKRT